MSTKPIKSHHVTDPESGRVVFIRCIRCGREGVEVAVSTGKARGVCVDCVRDRSQVANYWGGRSNNAH